jgi:hypothetical protein
LALSPSSQLSQYAVGDIFDTRIVGQVDRLADCAADERLGRGHHADVPLRRDVTRTPDGAAPVGAVEHRQVLIAQVRRALDGLRAADHAIELIDLLPRQAQQHQSVEAFIRAGTSTFDAEAVEQSTRACDPCA